MSGRSTPRLTGRRLALRAVTEADVSARYRDWLNDPTVNRYLETRFETQTLESVAQYVRRTAADPAQYFWAIRVGENGAHIGNIKLGPVNPHHGTADVTLFIGEKDAWGRGYATEAIALVSECAFRELGLEKLRAGAYAENTGSIRAFEKCGFHREGLLRSHAAAEGRRTDIVLLGRLAADAAPARA